MKKTIAVISGGLLLFGIFFSINLSQRVFFPIIEKLIGHYPGSRVVGIFHLMGLLFLLSSILLPIIYCLPMSHHQDLKKRYESISSKIHIWFESKLGKWMEFGKLPEKRLKFNALDILAIVLFIIFSTLFVLAQLQKDYPFVKLNSDAAYIISAQISRSDPQYFVKDPFFSNPENFAFYSSILLPVAEWVQRLVGNYSLAMMVLLGPIVFLYLLGYYLLGRSITQHRGWGFCTSVIGAVPMEIMIENLGLVNNPLPRFVFAALIPYVVWMAWNWRDQPKRWIFPTTCVGLLVYIHPVSAPGWAAAFLIGYLVFLPKEWSACRKILFMAMQVLVLIIIVAPYAFLFLNNRRFGAVENFDLVMQVITHFYDPAYYYSSLTFANFFIIMNQLALFPLTCMGLLLLWLIRQNSKSRLLLAWCLGIFIVSFMIPFIERIFESIMHLTPIEIELIRGYKQLVLIFILCTIILFHELTLRLKTQLLRTIPILLSLGVFILLFNARATYSPRFQPLFNCLLSGKLVCGTVSQMDEVILAIRDETPQGSSIFFSHDAYDTANMAVRYIGMHPLAYSWKDKNFIFSRPDLLDEWYQTYERLVEEGNTTDWYLRDPEGFMKFARGLGSDFVVLEKPRSSKILAITPNAAVFQNDTYVLFKVDITVPSTH
jgi:hypothetical protein